MLSEKEKTEKKQARLWKALNWVAIAVIISIVLIIAGAGGIQPLAIAGVLGLVFSFIGGFVIIGELEI